MKTWMISRMLPCLIIMAAWADGGKLIAGAAQPGPPPEHGLNGNQGGGNAPLGEGLVITLAMAGAYAARKIHLKRMEDGTRNNNTE